MQGFESSCDRVKKKGKKSRKSDDSTTEAGAKSALSLVPDGVESGNVQKIKSGKCKTFTKHAASKGENGMNSGSEAEHPAGKKKKSASGCSVNGHKIKSRDVIGAVDEKADKMDGLSANGVLNESLKSDKKRKGKSKDEKKVETTSSDNSQCADEHRSKKLKTHNENFSDDKTVVSSGDVEPGAFENYRISQSLVDKLQCTSVFSRVRTIMVLGYWALGNIHRYWIVLLFGGYFLLF